MPRLSKIGAAALAAFGWTSGGSSVTATYLVVAGGAGGGGALGGGGGAGGYQTGTASLNPTLSYTVTVGAGGAAGVTDGTEQGTQGGDGTNSVFNTVTSAGGGGGGTAGPSGGTAGLRSGRNGGSGGGGAGNDQQITSGGTGNTPSTSPSQGNNGGSNSTQSNPYPAAGGGGATAVGSNGSGSQSGAGGNGTASSISGASVTYAGGGGGGSSVQGAASGSGGTGGGGAGQTSSVAAVSGTANTGGGGGGGRNAANVTAGKGGSGVVIISYPGAQQFGGGVVTTDGTNTIHTFTTSGTLSVLVPLTASYLIVAGGASGGGNSAGGGGAGGLLTGSGLTIDTNSNYVVTVGAGGAGVGNNTTGNNGSGSSFNAYTTTGGGGGGGSTPGAAAGNSGGSGGGGQSGGNGANGGAGNTPSTSPSQGNNGGGTPAAGGTYPAGGGGGAGAVGGTPATNTSAGGAGGIGVASSISGTSTYYSGGGGGGSGGTAGAGGNGGGGAGVTSGTGVAGTANTGGGGGGGGTGGGAGGSGVVIIAYPGSTQQMAGGTVTISGGNVIHTFTSSGYLTPIKYASRSLRFRSSASAYLNRTFKTPTSGTTWTYSLWVKRGILGSSNQQLLSAGSSVSDQIYFQGGSTDKLIVYLGGSQTTTQVFRDPSSWYHIVVSVDTTQATNTNRLKLYVNGSQVTAFDATSYPTQNSTTKINSAVDHYISRYAASAGDYIDGYLTEINFIDGAALTPSSFGAYNSYGVWQPITYGGSYGTNGFYLTFGNNTSTTTLGYDTSPQGNNWTTNNISLTAGATYDSMTDVPTLTSATVANYCVLNPIFTNGFSPLTLTNGNLTATSSSGARLALGTMYATTDAYYFEATCTTVAAAGSRVGIRNDSTQRFYDNSGNYFDGATSAAYGATYTTGDVIGVAFDLTNQTITFYKNNTSQGQKTAIGLTGILVAPFVYADTSGVWNLNFGQRPFTYTPPSGFVALNTYNLSTPTIPNGAAQFAATLYTGTGAALTVSNTVNGTNFQPDWVWVKSRSAATNHKLTDVVRGVTKALISNTAGTETTDTNGLTAFGSTGFTLGTDTVYNNSAATYVAWQWKAGNSSGVTNTDGILTSTVSANTTAGFSICTYTAPSSSQANSFGHGLGVAPSMVIAKSRSGGSGGLGWAVYHTSLGADQFLSLNSAAAATTVSGYWGTGMTSTVVGLRTGASSSGSDNVTGNMVAYCFAPIAGYSAFGSYTGNNSTDGPFVFLGFRPRWVMIKRVTDGVQGWNIWDNSRNPYNTETLGLFPDGANAEQTTNSVDVLSNGFKLRSADTTTNSSGINYVYAAFAENPFKYSLAR